MANHPPRAAAMDPPHITEFASERYFEKLNQLNAQQQQPQQQQQQPVIQSLDAPGPSSAPRFSLPLRESQNKREKGRFSSIRQKVSLRHSKPSPAEPVSPEPSSWIPQLSLRFSTESTRRSLPLDQLFLSLPNELQIQVISSLPLADILNLRLASKSWHALITLNEAPIVRYHLENNIPAYARRLYPVTDLSGLTLNYLCGLWHRLHVAAKLSFLMCEWITKDIFLRQTEIQRMAFAPQSERMRRRLTPLLFTIFHFFETYRKLHLEHLAENGINGMRRQPYTFNPIEAQIMNLYDDKTLLRVHEVFPLVISSFCRRLRPPTYVGRVERSLRGYLREKPSDDVHVAILLIGGLRQVERLWEIKGYNTRRGAVDTWFHGLTKDRPAPEPTPAKPKRSLMSFGRKKSSGVDRSTSDNSGRRRSSAASINSTDMPFDSNFVFNTSLAAGFPMSPIGRSQAQAILSDLPVLQQIWLVTAEAMVLERKVVERPQDIKRNQQVMLDLIREDGLDEEDEWWYGHNIADSIRPLIGVNDDDAD